MAPHPLHLSLASSPLWTFLCEVLMCQGRSSGHVSGLLHSGHVSLPSLWLPHEHYSHCLNKALTRSESFSNSLHCKSGVEAKAESITQMHHHVKQIYDLQVIHDSINCLFFPVLSEILAIESLGIINSWTR